jgi:hypothetical protein
MMSQARLLDPRRTRPEGVTWPDLSLTGDGSLESGNALQAAVDTGAANVHIRGTFLIDNVEHPGHLRLYHPVRIVGDDDGTAVIRTGAPFVVASDLVVLENVRVVVRNKVQVQMQMCMCAKAVCNSGLGCGPAVQVMQGHLIAHKLTCTSVYGPPVRLRKGTSAYLQDCTLSTRCIDGLRPHAMSDGEELDVDSEAKGEECVGIDAECSTTLAMYECTVKDANWGVCACTCVGDGESRSVLGRHNTFSNIHRERFKEKVIDRSHKPCVGHVAQPWREDWVVATPGAGGS